MYASGELNNDSSRTRATGVGCNRRETAGCDRGRMRKKVSRIFSCNPYRPFQARIYDAIRARKLGTKRSVASLPRPTSRACMYRVLRDFVGERQGDACMRLQDEINTILCKRVRLIARGKASGISGIPNKLTLNAEGSPPLFHPSTLPPTSPEREW